ncbi:MAG: hypothetical protein AAFY85_08225 [Pseudomonadota bacterium]
MIYRSGVVYVARLLSVLAIVAYACNGALAHVSPAGSLTFHAGQCGPGGVAQTIVLGDVPAEETGGTCCGDCLSLPVLSPTPPFRITVPIASRLNAPLPAAPEVSPRSPLWPGAPPQGPPQNREA